MELSPVSSPTTPRSSMDTSTLPRRPSYVFATQTTRNGSGDRNVTPGGSTVVACGLVELVDFTENAASNSKRKNSYREATQTDINTVTAPNSNTPAGNHFVQHHGPSYSQPDGPSYSQHDGPVYSQHDGPELHPPSDIVTNNYPTPGDYERITDSACYRPHDAPDTILGETDKDPETLLANSKWRYTKNLVVLSLSFILVFTAFRSIQNLQSSLNSASRLGVTSMCCVHTTMFLTCLFAPIFINRLTSKWTIVVGFMFYLAWIAANFYPHVYTLIPTSIGVGFGQSLAWGAQVTYIQKLALDYAHLSKEMTQQEMYKFNGIFLACFQTSHIWGNLVSSLLLGASGGDDSSVSEGRLVSGTDDEVVDSVGKSSSSLIGTNCGVYEPCFEPAPLVWNNTVTSASNPVLKLMGSYLVFAFTGFLLILLFLEKIGAKANQEKPCLQMVLDNIRQLVQHKTYRLLVPLLIFNGFEQGFVYSDYTKVLSISAVPATMMSHSRTLECCKVLERPLRSP